MADMISATLLDPRAGGRADPGPDAVDTTCES
jgi:hypothetical protein